MDLKSVFEMEYKMAVNYMEHTEFFEGVRALLVDKDKSPKWKHSSVNDVTQKEVDAFFNRPEHLTLNISETDFFK